MINKARMKLIEQVAKVAPIPELQGTFKRGSDWIVTDTVRVLFLREKPDLPEVEGTDYDFKDILYTSLDCCDSEPPSIDIIRQVIVEAKYTEKGKTYYLPYEIFPNVFVNPKLLLDMLKIFPKTYMINWESGWRPIVFVDDDIDSPDNCGALFTIRKDVHAPYVSYKDGMIDVVNPNMGEYIKQEDI